MQKQQQEPIMVQNPENGLFIDVRPFFNLIFDNYNSDYGLKCLQESAEGAIRYVNIECMSVPDVSPDENNRLNFFDFLYSIKDLTIDTTIAKNQKHGK